MQVSGHCPATEGGGKTDLVKTGKWVCPYGGRSWYQQGARPFDPPLLFRELEVHCVASLNLRRRPEACGKSKQHFPVVGIGETNRSTIHGSLVRRNDHAEWDADHVGSSVKFGAPPRPLRALEAVNREAGTHTWRSADSIRQKPGLTGTRHIGRVVVEIENLVWRNLETRGQAAEGLRVGLAPAELRREDRPRAEDVGDGGKHLCDVSLQEQRVVGEHSDRPIRAELSRKREHGQVGLDRHFPGLDPLGCAEGIPHALAESLQVVVRRYDPALRLVLEPRMPDGGMDRVRALPAPRREECQPALDPVVTEDAVHIEDDCLDQERSLRAVCATDGRHHAAEPRVTVSATRRIIMLPPPPYAGSDLPRSSASRQFCATRSVRSPPG